ncbi:MAG: DUF2169 domain-containing protein [Isosphaeraceae bacterium]
MELINATGMQAAYTMGLQPDGRELLVVVVKGTFTIPKDPKQEPEIAEEQVPLVAADVFTGEPGFSAPLYESDYAPRKPRCDILLNGSAYAPGGKPTERVTVSLRVGSWQKSFDVVGNRYWKSGVLLVTPTDPEPFTVMPISYNNAFGGVDRSQEDPAKHRWYPTNHAGVGYHEYLDAEFIDGKPLPNTEETGRRITDPRGKYRPMAFGPIGRAWPPRPKYAGTYDQKWLDEVSPFLPKDFDDRYFQAAPLEQQTDYPRGGEDIVLTNLMPGGPRSSKLPMLDMPIEFTRRDGKRQEMKAVIDTVVVEPDLGRFQVVWRTSLPLRRNIFEVTAVVAGRMSPGWYRARAAGKEYYRSLREMVMSKERET